MPEIAERVLIRLLRQARGWFSPHPDRADAVSVQASPRDVQEWMRDTDHALLDGEPPPPRQEGS